MPILLVTISISIVASRPIGTHWYRSNLVTYQKYPNPVNGFDFYMCFRLTYLFFLSGPKRLFWEIGDIGFNSYSM